MKENKNKRIKLLVFNDPHPLRINKELANEIGLNESIVLLQIEYLIGISNTEEKDGRMWTYQSLSDLQAHFPWWSKATISRAINNLKDEGYIFIENYNKKKYDRTHWFALNEKVINEKLSSVKVDVQAQKSKENSKDKSLFQNETSILQNETCMFQNEKWTFQNETTIPETPTENTTKTTTKEYERKQKECFRSDKEKNKIKDIEAEKQSEDTDTDRPTSKKELYYNTAIALAEVCNIGFEENKGMLFKEAQRLNKSTDKDPALIRELFGQSGTWYKSDWRGQKGEYPKPHQIRQEWYKVLEYHEKHEHNPGVRGKEGGFFA